jgi:AAA+ superfamily predicted ATPase
MAGMKGGGGTDGGTFYSRIRKHLKAEPSALPVVERTFPLYHRANLQLAIDEIVGREGAKYALEGVVVRHDYEGVSLARLAHPRLSRDYSSGPVEYRDAELADASSLACVRRGVYRIRTAAGGRVVMMVSQEKHSYPPRLVVEVMGEDRDAAQDFAREVAAAAERSPAFRGQVVSLRMDCDRELTVRFHRLPRVRREEIVLPEEVLRRIDRHAEGFVRQIGRLRAAGRHLKRGILLHGPPGTGKTLSAMYLAAQMPGRTVMILTAGGLSSIETSGQLARALAPATVILEDVDLIGTVREHQDVGANALLFELLNQMDGLAEDADVLFVLTTNRPDVLEPALASRPGRIDQAIEIPLPDETCRRRLFELYARGLDVRLADVGAIVARTAGVSAAFIREMLRKAAMLAAEEGGDSADGDGAAGSLVVSDAHVRGAIEELLVAGGVITKRLLGVSVEGE